MSGHRGDKPVARWSERWTGLIGTTLQSAISGASLYCGEWTRERAVYSVQCYSVECKVYSVQYCSVECKVCSVQGAVCS